MSLRSLFRPGCIGLLVVSISLPVVVSCEAGDGLSRLRGEQNGTGKIGIAPYNLSPDLTRKIEDCLSHLRKNPNGRTTLSGGDLKAIIDFWTRGVEDREKHNHSVYVKNIALGETRGPNPREIVKISPWKNPIIQHLIDTHVIQDKPLWGNAYAYLVSGDFVKVPLLNCLDDKNDPTGDPRLALQANSQISKFLGLFQNEKEGWMTIPSVAYLNHQLDALNVELRKRGHHSTHYRYTKVEEKLDGLQYLSLIADGLIPRAEVGALGTHDTTYHLSAHAWPKEVQLDVRSIMTVTSIINQDHVLQAPSSSYENLKTMMRQSKHIKNEAEVVKTIGRMIDASSRKFDVVNGQTTTDLYFLSYGITDDAWEQVETTMKKLISQLSFGALNGRASAPASLAEGLATGLASAFEFVTSDGNLQYRLNDQDFEALRQSFVPAAEAYISSHPRLKRRLSDRGVTATTKYSLEPLTSKYDRKNRKGGLHALRKIYEYRWKSLNESAEGLEIPEIEWTDLKE